MHYLSFSLEYFITKTLGDFTEILKQRISFCNSHNSKLFDKTFRKYYFNFSKNSCHFCELLSIQFLPSRLVHFFGQEIFENKRANCLAPDNDEGDNDDDDDVGQD